MTGPTQVTVVAIFPGDAPVRAAGMTENPIYLVSSASVSLYVVLVANGSGVDPAPPEDVPVYHW